MCEVKVLVFMGSPRLKGNTSRLSKFMCEELSNRGHKVTFISSPIIKQCLHCGKCSEVNKCVQKDSVSKAVNSFKEYDALVIMTPIYYFQFSGQTKSFIDRLGCNEDKYWENKVISLITSSGSQGRRGGHDLVEESVLRTCEWYQCQYAGSYNKVTKDLITEITEVDKESLRELIIVMEVMHNEACSKKN